jgi:hypothetical protein
MSDSGTLPLKWIGKRWIGPIHVAGHEILRRLFVTVRDKHWHETEASHFDVKVERAGNIARLSARHTSMDVDFEWQGTFEVEDEGRSLRFHFRGEALRDMEICRLGLVVLHPVESLVGAHLTAGSEHSTQRLIVADRLSPQPIVHGVPGAMTEPFSMLTIQQQNVGALELRFDGDLFELEDQRNWGDHSFKTYCTPLRCGYPRGLRRGERIKQNVRIKFTPARVGISERPRQDPVHEVRSWTGSLGCVGTRTDGPWDHIHIDCSDGRHDRILPALTSTIPQPLEIAVSASTPDSEVRAFGDLLSDHSARIARLLLYGPGIGIPEVQDVERYRRALRSTRLSSVPILAATRGYFVEFNRGLPFPGDGTGVAFPLTATVHGNDRETILSNVAAIESMAATAHELTAGAPIALVPLALYHPFRSELSAIEPNLVLGWLSGTLHHAPAICSITLSNDVLDVLTAHVGPLSAERIRALAMTALS